MNSSRRPLIAIVACCVTSIVLAEDAPTTSLPYTPSLDISAMDRSARPCDDFYQYACGGWKKNNPIPADQASWSVYAKAYQDNQRYLWGLLEEDARPGNSRNPTQALVGDFFAACMDTPAIEQAGLGPATGDLALIDALADKSELGTLLGDLQARTGGAGFFFGFGAEQDARESTRVVGAIYPGGLGLPDRDYYVKADPKSRETRERYVAHVARMLELLGDTPAAAKEGADTVMRIETALAKASLTLVERRDPYQVYHRVTPPDLPSLAPAIDWKAYARATGIDLRPWVNVADTGQLRAVQAAIASEPLAAIRTYLRWALVNARAAELPKTLVDADFDFYSRYLNGVPEQPPRWKTCVAQTDAFLGEALGREFVERNFPPEARDAAVRMTEQIQDAMRARIEQLDWMSPETRRQALDKLAKMRNKVGYPDRWRDYSTVTIVRDQYYRNVEGATLFETRRQMAKIGKPLDRDEWLMSPTTVNAYYNPSMNDINFPAGVLMPPLFDTRMDDAPNYGDTGGTIGHELTHGFDDEGRNFDGDGNLRDWWTADDARQFELRAQCIRGQYSSYVVVDDVKINGKLTSGEDIADLGGLIIAYMAWQQQTQGQPLKAADDLTPEQRFFVGFAQWACGNYRPENLRVRAMTDPHSPLNYRVNGVVVNMPEFVKAFSCKAGDKLYRPESQRCKVW